MEKSIKIKPIDYRHRISKGKTESRRGAEEGLLRRQLRNGAGVLEHRQDNCRGGTEGESNCGLWRILVERAFGEAHQGFWKRL